MKTKRMTTLLLALVMAVGLAVPAAAAPITFKDVKTSDWFYSDVQKAVDTGLIDGYPDNTYGPAINMKYAEAIKLAAVMYKMSMTGSNEFETVNPWYQPYVDYAKNTGVISKDYDWEKPATRAGYMEIFAKAIPDMPALAGMKGLTAINTVPDGSIPDVPMSHPQAAAIYKLYRAGILQGNDAQHTCRPDSNIQRSEVAAILTRMMNPGERLSFSMGAESPLEIAAQPADVTVSVGGDATFSVGVSGGKTPYTYEWRRIRNSDGEDLDLSDWTYLSGSKTAELTVKNLVANESGDMYYCIITDADNKTVTSGRATLTVTEAPLAVDKMSRNQGVAEGSDVLLYVEVTGGKAPYTYQWQYCYPGETKFWNLEDAAEHGEKFKVENNGARSELTLLKFNTLITNQSGSKYRCLITDANHNTKTSDPITVTLAGPRS